MDRYIHTNCSYTEQHTPEGEHMYTFTGPCRVTGTPYSVAIPGHELWDLNQGKSIQVALKSLTAEQREFVMNGTSPLGWSIMFGNRSVHLYEHCEGGKE